MSVVTEALRLDLETDRVLSLGQVARYYGFKLADLPSDLIVFDAFLATTHHSMDYQRFQFVTLERKVAQYPAASLRHLAGVAEMRRLLSAHRDQWRSEANTRFASEVPDAIWTNLEGDVAVEYDAGSYSPRKIVDKAVTFKRYAGQVWGSPSARRVRHLETLLGEVGEFTPPILAPWH